METIAGFLVGYLLGTRAGRNGLDELTEAWGVISSSDEVRGLVAMAGSTVSGLVAQATAGNAGRAGSSIAPMVLDTGRRLLERRSNAV